MSRLLVTEREAEAEAEAAAHWYEERGPGLGRRFLSGVAATVDGIRRHPGIGAPVRFVPPHLRVRRAPVKRFPYHVVYFEVSDVIHILAVAHDRRRPRYWTDRLTP